MSIPHLLTAEQLERIAIPGKVTELVRGQLVVREPPGTWHGAISSKLTLRLGVFVEQQGLGVVFAQDTGFKIGFNPDTVRAPDVAYVRREQSKKIQRSGYAPVAPDLLAEVLSHDDRPVEVLQKVAQWLAAGTKIVWVVDPERREVHVHRGDGSLSILHEDDVLDGEDVLPGFTCPIADLLRL